MNQNRNPGDLQAIIDRLGLKVVSTFIPFSQSRNKVEKYRSLKAESMYRQCVDTGLKLRAALGDKALSELRDAFSEY